MLTRPKLAAVLGTAIGATATAVAIPAASTGATSVVSAVAPTAVAARSAGVRDEGRLHYVSDDATTIVDEGRLSGTIPGQARVGFTYNASPEVSATFTIRAASGTIRGRARCRLSNPNSRAPSFRGALQIVGGSGRYAHARGTGELFGVFYRRGYGLVFQAIGRLRY